MMKDITGSSPADESASGRARFDAVSDLSRDPGGSPAFAIHADWNSTSYRITLYYKDLRHNSHAQRHTDFFVQDGTVAVAPIVLSTYIRALYCVTPRYAMARLLQSQDGRTTLLLKEGATSLDSWDEPHNFVTIVDQVKAM